LDFCNGGSAQKTKVVLIPGGGKSLTIRAFVSIEHQSVTDGQTDRFAITVSRSACIGMLTRDN